MCVKVNFDLYNRQRNNYNPVSFKGYKTVKNDYGERIYEFNYPYDSKLYDCYLEVCSVETDKDKNYFIVEGLKNYLSPDGYLKLKPGANRINLGEAFDLQENEPFAYHYALVPKGANRNNHGVYPIYKLDAGDYINFKNSGEHEIYNIVTGSNPTTNDIGSMKLLMPDFYNPLWTYDDNGKIVKNTKYDDKIKNTAKTFSNKLGGNLAGIEKDVRDGKFDGYSRIISTPLFTDDSLSSHAYWNKNCMQIAQGLGNINNYASLQREMFKKGLNFVSDGAYVNEGLEGIHFKHVLKWGEKSPYFEWFKAQNLKNGPLALGVFSKNTDFIRHRVVNSPYTYKQDLQTGKVVIGKNRLYDSKQPTYIQIYDNRLVSDKLKNDTQHLIKEYDVLNTENLLDITNHNDTVMPYAFEINPETYNKNIERLNEYNKNLNKSKNINLHKTMDYAIGIVFPANNNTEKLKDIRHKLAKAVDDVENTKKDIKYPAKVALAINTAKSKFNLDITDDEEKQLSNTLLKLKNTIPLESYLGTRFATKFEYFELEEKIEGNVTTWDANTDIPKLNYMSGNADTQQIKMNYSYYDQPKASSKLNAKSYEVQDYAITSAKYWTGKTSDILNLYVAQQLKINPADITNPGKIYTKILNLIDGGNLPKKLRYQINYAIIRNVLTGEYELQGDKNDLEYKKYLLESLMSLPLDSIEFGDGLTAVLGSSYISKRATDEKYLGKSRYEMFVQHNPHILPQYASTYEKMDDIYQKELLKFADEIITNLNNIMPDENSKIYDGYNTTIYGRYVIPYLAEIITKFAIIKALAPNTPFKVNETNGEITYDYNKLKGIDLPALHIVASSPQEEAQQVLAKLQSGIKNISNEDKKRLTETLYETIQGTTANSFKLAEMITDRLNAGLDWRIDAAKDIGDIDSVKSGTEKIGNVWPDVTKFWKHFTDAVYQQNRNAYIVAEITDEGVLYKNGHGDLTSKYNDSKEMIKKFLRESNIISLPNYSHFFTSIVNFFGYHFDRNEKDGNNYHDDKISKRFNDKWNDFFEYMPYSGILNSYNFIGNHDKPRVLHGLIINTNWYTTNLTDVNNTYYREKAFRLLNNKHTGPIVTEANYANKEEFEKAAIIAVDEQNLKFTSGKSLAMADALYEAFKKTFQYKNPLGNATINQKTAEKIYAAITDLARGLYKGKRIHPEGFGVKPMDVAIDIIFEDAKSEHQLTLSDTELEKLKAETLNTALTPALKKLRAMTEVLVTMPGLPTLYAGDDIGATGYESESKNIYLQNRGVIHNEWLDPTNTNYKFIQDHYEKMNKLMKMRGRKELHAMNDGAPFVLDVQQGWVNDNRKDRVNISAILRQGSDNSIVISLINPTGLQHGFEQDYNPLKVTLESITVQNNDVKNEHILTKGLEENTILYNANDINDKYVVRQQTKYENGYPVHCTFIKRLVKDANGQERDSDIILDGTTLTLYSKPDITPQRKWISDRPYPIGPIVNPNKDLDADKLGKKLSLVL